MAAPDLFDRLYDAHAPALHAFLLNLTRHEEDTRDLLQDSIEELLRRQPIRLPPVEWREEILRTARAQQPVQPARVWPVCNNGSSSMKSFSSSLNPRPAGHRPNSNAIQMRHSVAR